MGDIERLLVVGSGRSGTGLAAEILRRAGLKCGHENVFLLTGDEAYHPDWADYDAESSWLAVPYLPQHNLYGRAVLMVRHPLNVVRSLMQLDQFNQDKMDHPVRVLVKNYVYKFWPEVGAERSQVDRCAAAWLYLTNAALPYVHETVRMESVVKNPNVLLNALGVNTRAHVRKFGRVNSKDEDKRAVGRIGWTDLRPELSEKIQQLARTVGYDY